MLAFFIGLNISQDHTYWNPGQTFIFGNVSSLKFLISSGIVFQDGFNRFLMKAMFSMFSQKIIGQSLQPSLLGWKLNHYLTRQRYTAPPLLADSPFDLDTCAAWVFSSMMMCNSSIICLTNLQFRLFLQLATEYVVRVSFGTALIASIVIVYTTIIALLSSRRYLDVNPCFSVVPFDWLEELFFLPKTQQEIRIVLSSRFHDNHIIYDCKMLTRFFFPFRNSDEDNRGRRGGRSYDSAFTFYLSPSDLFW